MTSCKHLWCQKVSCLFLSSLSIIVKGRIAYLLKRTRLKEFSRKRPKDYTANLVVLKQGSRQGHGISNPHRQRQEEKKKEESDEMNVDTSSANQGNKQLNNIIYQLNLKLLNF